MGLKLLVEQGTSHLISSHLHLGTCPTTAVML